MRQDSKTNEKLMNNNPMAQTISGGFTDKNDSKSKQTIDIS